MPSGVTTSGLCIHAEFFFHVTDPTKKVYFRGYQTGDYPTMGGNIIYVSDASLTYEFISE